MLILIVVTSSLFYTLTLAQTSTGVPHPSLGPVIHVPNNDSVLNFTFVYPSNYTFDKLSVRFTLYDFIGNETLNPQAFPFSWNNFTNNDTSLPWVVPPVILQAGDYIIACFEWVQRTMSDSLVADINQCILTRTTKNNATLPIATPNITIFQVTNITATVCVFFPAELPYDQVTMASTLNGTIIPSWSNSTTTAVYTSVATYLYINLMPGTNYNFCVNITYANSNINGTQMSSSLCQNISTLGPNITPTTNSPTNNSSNKIVSNCIFMILLFIFALI